MSRWTNIHGGMPFKYLFLAVFFMKVVAVWGQTNAPATSNRVAGQTVSRSITNSQSISGTSQVPEFSDFRIILDRNIFAARRSGAVRARGNTQTQQQRRMEFFTLVGTLEYSNKRIAFFDSINPAFRKAVPEGASLGDFKVSSISYKRVKLLYETNEYDLQVGWQMQRAEGDTWIVSQDSTRSAEGSRGGSVEFSSSSARFSGGTGGSSTSGPASDVLRRLMERREQELQ